MCTTTKSGRPCFLSTAVTGLIVIEKEPYVAMLTYMISFRTATHTFLFCLVSYMRWLVQTTRREERTAAVFDRPIGYINRHWEFDVFCGMIVANYREWGVIDGQHLMSCKQDIAFRDSDHVMSKPSSHSAWWEWRGNTRT